LFIILLEALEFPFFFCFNASALFTLEGPASMVGITRAGEVTSGRTTFHLDSVIVRQQTPLHLSFGNNGSCTTETVAHSTRILEIKYIILCILQTLPIPASINQLFGPSPTRFDIFQSC
jgi:hypothetical protein